MATINTPQLTNTNISDTYLGVLHSRGIPLPVATGGSMSNGQEVIHDGYGNQSALALGQQNQGASITGNLSSNQTVTGNYLVANQLTMPRIETGNANDIVITNGSGTLSLAGFSDVFNAVYSALPDGTYINPRITVANGLITSIASRGEVRNYVWRVVPNAPGVNSSFFAEGTVDGITGIEGAVQTSNIQTFLHSVWPLGVSPNTTGVVGDIAIVTQYGKKYTEQSRISFRFYDLETYISTAVFKRIGSLNTAADWINNGYANTNYYTDTTHQVFATNTTFSATNYLIS